MTNISWRFFNVKFALFALLALWAFASHAEEAAAPAQAKSETPESGPQVWLTSGFISHHFKRDAGYNERNHGLGAEVRFDENNTVAGGFYRNSVRQTTHYLHFVWTPLELGPVRLGAAVGVIDGYPQLNNGNAALAVMPVATTSFKLFSQDAGINLVYIPTVAQRVDGALALQFKMRIH
jgi:hypothetical protein